MGSIVLPPHTPASHRKYSYNLNNGVLSLGSKDTANSVLPTCKRSEPKPPKLPPRRNSLATAAPPTPLKLHSVTLSGGMESRYHRPSSPRGRFANPARSSTGTFADPSYYDSSSSYYPRQNTSPRSSTGAHQPYTTYTPSSSSSGSRTAALKYDSYSGRPRRNTHDSDDRLVRPNLRELPPPPPTASIPIRSPGVPHNLRYDRPSSPLAHSFDSRGDTYITHGPSRHEHKRIYSVDDNSHKTKLVAEREVIEPRRHEKRSSRDYDVTSGNRNYHSGSSSSSSKPYTRPAELNDDSYSYTDPASMYRDTEPAWRRPRSGSMERGSRPSSMIMDRGPRSSNRELGPPPSTRGFDKINNGVPRRDPPGSSSIERSREAPKYEAYPDAVPARSASTRHHAPAIHQDTHRRDTTNDYDRRDWDLENRRQPAPERFEDRDVATRGFGIAPGLINTNVKPDHQPIWSAHEQSRPRADDYSAPYYPPDPRTSDSRLPRDQPPAPKYNERPQGGREAEPRSHHSSSSAAPIAAGAAVGAVATIGAAHALKSREADREADRERDREYERERERRREHDERDRRDRASDDRRERHAADRREPRMHDERREPPKMIEPERYERGLEDRKDDRIPLAAAAYASTHEPERKAPRERRYEDDEADRRSREPREPPRERRHDDDGRERKSRRAPSSDGSGEERARHYVDRDAARDSDRRKDGSAAEAPLDPDEEYRRRIQQEMDRNGRPARDSDSDRERERRRRKEDRDRSRDPSRGPSSAAPDSRYEDRSRGVLDTNVVQEPDSISSPAGGEQPSKSVQIVAPPKEPEPKPRGILRKPTEKFPEDPDPIREGVAPHKSVTKGKDIPVGARWTKIDRRLVNPEALEEAKERFEERMDCVIVLRVLTKEQIQKLADRTKEIRESREDEEYERRDRDRDRDRDRERERDRDRDRERDRDRDRERHRSHRDEEDRDRERRRDYDDSDYDDVGRRDYERERSDRDRPPRMIEAGR